MTLLVSWRGTIVEYPGRVHRLHARIFDRRCRGKRRSGIGFYCRQALYPAGRRTSSYLAYPKARNTFGSVLSLLVDPELPLLDISSATAWKRGGGVFPCPLPNICFSIQNNRSSWLPGSLRGILVKLTTQDLPGQTPGKKTVQRGANRP
jgi:hypothetical protein